MVPYPQAILKFHRPSSLDYSARKRNPADTVGYIALIKLDNYKSHVAIDRLDEFGENILNSNQSRRSFCLSNMTTMTSVFLVRDFI